MSNDPNRPARPPPAPDARRRGAEPATTTPADADLDPGGWPRPGALATVPHPAYPPAPGVPDAPREGAHRPIPYPPHGSPPMAPPYSYPPQGYPAPAYPPAPYGPPQGPYGHAQPGYPPAPQGYPAPGPAPHGYPPPMGMAVYGAPAPINIVVQNTTAGAVPPGALVRVGNRSRMVAALLALFVGAFGAHRFYLGRTLSGVVYLVFFWTFLPSIAAFVEFILLLAMSDQDFDRKFNTALTR